MTNFVSFFLAVYVFSQYVLLSRMEPVARNIFAYMYLLLLFGYMERSNKGDSHKPAYFHTSHLWNNNNNNNMQYIRNIDREVISEEDTFLSLLKGDRKAETESEIEAAQDQALQTDR